MNRLENKQPNPANIKHRQKRFVRALAFFVAALMIPFYILLTSTSSQALVPAYAKISQILGLNDLSLRSGSQSRPASLNSVLNIGQQLVLSSTNRTFVQLDFYNRSNQPMGLAVQVSTKNNLPTMYYFPCTLQQGDSLLIEWVNQQGSRRGCERAIRVQPGQRLKLGA